MVSASAGDSLTVHAASVRISATSMSVCAGLSRLPVTVAAARAGSPGAIPTPTPDPDGIEEPDTGGYALPGNALLLMMMIGIVAILGSLWFITHARRGEKTVRKSD